MKSKLVMPCNGEGRCSLCWQTLHRMPGDLPSAGLDAWLCSCGLEVCLLDETGDVSVH